MKNDGENLIESHIVKDVYAEIYPWEPKVYDRTFNLIEAVNGDMINDNELQLYIDDNIARSHHMYRDNEPLEPYAQIVETGIRYDYPRLLPYNKPRPFFQNSVDELIL